MKVAGFPSSVVLYGTGLMGCSLALALRRQNPKIKIYGVDDRDVLERARELQAIEITAAPPKAADLLILATPVSAILKQLEGSALRHNGSHPGYRKHEGCDL
jgi:prephenate dehydrogenase